MKIIGIKQQSLAANAGFKIGDDLIKLNGHPIRDEIDYRFHVSDEQLKIEILRDGERLIFEIEKDCDDDPGILFKETKYHCCRNKCIFCFIDQNPKGLRESLYFKDEDFRLSFLYGNYITLTNVSNRDLRRIVEQRLSPIYISVHSTDLEIRKLMLGLPNDDELIEKIRFLADHHIELHAQIVLCPSINDGHRLIKTIADLSQFYPQMKSVAIVPVGLTQHRRQLYPLPSVTTFHASELIEQTKPIAMAYKKRYDDYFIYLADEFYILAGVELPQAERYDDFPQIENGVGMTRAFIDQFKEQSQKFPHRITNRCSITLVTGILAASIMNQVIVPRLNEIENLKADLITIENNFYGKSITVSGLLTGQDIIHQLNKPELGDIVVLPSNCLNFDGLFLDDWTLKDLTLKLHRPIETVDKDFVSMIKKLDIRY